MEHGNIRISIFSVGASIRGCVCVRAIQFAKKKDNRNFIPNTARAPVYAVLHPQQSAISPKPYSPIESNSVQMQRHTQKPGKKTSHSLFILIVTYFSGNEANYYCRLRLNLNSSQ